MATSSRAVQLSIVDANSAIGVVLCCSLIVPSGCSRTADEDSPSDSYLMLKVLCYAKWRDGDRLSVVLKVLGLMSA